MFAFNRKLVLAAAGLVLAFAAVMYLLIVPKWATAVSERAVSDVKRAASLIAHKQRVYAYDMVALAGRVAADQKLADAIQQESGARRRAVFAAIDEVDGSLKRKAHFFAVVDIEGKVIARDLNIKDMAGDKLPFPSVGRAIKGLATSDVWMMKNRLMRGAAAPIYVNNEIKGAVVLAYDFTAKEARQDANEFGTDVAYFLNDAIRASSFVAADGGGEAGQIVKAVQAKMVKGGQANAALKAGKVGDAFVEQVKGINYVSVAGPLPAAVVVGGTSSDAAAGSNNSAGFIVMANLDSRGTEVVRARWVILAFTLLFLLVALGGMYLVARYFVNAEDGLERGVNEVLNGNVEYVFDAMNEFEGLSNALNAMLARLLGRPEPGEDEEGDANWRADVLSIGELAGAADAALADEEEGAYYARIHNEYVEARKAANLPVDGLTLESFTQKARANAAMLASKHKCSGVRFSVVSGGGAVTLQPHQTN